MATRKRHSPEQVVRKLMTADRLLSEGKDVAALCRELGFLSRPTTVGATSSAA
jgi:putative transposase